MENKGYPKVLYHYASMEKGTSILKHKNIRLSDITKSNDVKEMSIFFPDLFDEMLKNYDEHIIKCIRLALYLFLHSLFGIFSLDFFGCSLLNVC